jgi:GTPase
LVANTNHKPGKSEAPTQHELSACIIVGVNFGTPLFNEVMDECALLAKTAGLHCVEAIRANRQAPDAATFIGSGKVEELRERCEAHQAAVVVFANAIGPVQQRNLVQALGRPVIDRTALILDIFAQRAQSHEGKLQVQLARAQYQATRLVRQWSHLERQRGGIGVRGGPGERQLELDKRMLRDQIKGIKERLAKVQKQRDTQRRARMRSGALRVAIVGYTNAGKSTLFSALTKSSTYVADQLFATLDPTTRRIKLSDGTQLSMSDTVGFVRELPHMLVAAFKSTLQEAMDADLLLHVVDSSSPIAAEQIQAVDEVLAEINAADIPQWLVHNKIDNTGHSAGYAQVLAEGQTPVVHHFYVSARTGQGVAAIREALAEAALHHHLPFNATGMSQSSVEASELVSLASTS